MAYTDFFCPCSPVEDQPLRAPPAKRTLVTTIGARVKRWGARLFDFLVGAYFLATTSLHRLGLKPDVAKAY